MCMSAVKKISPASFQKGLEKYKFELAMENLFLQILFIYLFV